LKKNVFFLITLFRGMMATTLGLVLLFQPDKTLPMLANFMGMFWLASGIISLRWGANGERAHGWALLAGAIGMLAGITTLSRSLLERWIVQDVMLSLLGVIILLTGVLHAFGGFRIGEREYRKWSSTSLALGVFEAILGLMLIVEPLGRGDFFYLVVSVWALVGGFILIGDALRLRRASAS
jgi:uncharacterized membrane protein HdeD (DUF308 family)